MNISLPEMGSPKSTFKYRQVELNDHVMKGALALSSGIKEIGSAFLDWNIYLRELKEKQKTANQAESVANAQNETKREKDSTLGDNKNISNTHA